MYGQSRREGLTDKIPLRVGLNKGSFLSLHLFQMIRDVLACGLKYLPRGACYLLTTLYWVAPEDRKLTMNWENFGRQGGGAEDQ